MYIYRYQVLHCSLIVEKALSSVILMIDSIYVYKVSTKIHIHVIMIILTGVAKHILYNTYTRR